MLITMDNQSQIAFLTNEMGEVANVKLNNDVNFLNVIQHTFRDKKESVRYKSYE
jgi:hypothetical protein